MTRFHHLLLLVLLVANIAGCGARQVPVTSDNYVPTVKPYSFPHNSGIYISSVWNRDASTVKWGYKDADKRLWYMFDSSIEDYVRKSLSNAFFKAGLKVYNSTPSVNVNVHGLFDINVDKDIKDANVPGTVNDLKVSITSISSRAVDFRLSIYKGELMVYSENLKAALDEGVGGKSSDSDFQAYAYRLTDKMVETILSNAEFNAALAK